MVVVVALSSLRVPAPTNVQDLRTIRAAPSIPLLAANITASSREPFYILSIFDARNSYRLRLRSSAIQSSTSVSIQMSQQPQTTFPTSQSTHLDQSPHMNQQPTSAISRGHQSRPTSCDFCFERKVNCSPGQQHGRCQNCVDSSQQCTYNRTRNTGPIPRNELPQRLLLEIISSDA